MPLTRLSDASVADRLQLMNPTPAARHGVAVIDVRALHLKLVNARFAALHGYDVNDLIRRSAAAVFSPAFCQRLAEHINANSDACSYRQQTINVRKDGSTFAADVEVNIIKNSYGEPYLCLVRVHPIGAEQTAGSRIIRLPEDALRQIGRDISHDVVRYDRRCRYVFVNAAAQKTLGGTPHELIGKTPVEVLGPQAAELQKNVETVFRSGVMLNAECFAPSRHGGSIAVGTLTLMPEFDEQDRVVSVIAVAHELAELRNTRQQLEESRLLLHSMVTRHDADIEAERKHIAREIHDDLGQVLTALRIKVDTCRLQHGGSHPEQDQSLQQIQQLVTQAFGVVRNVAASLRPAALDMGLVAALEWMVQKFRDDNGIFCELGVDEADIDLDDERAVAVFRIVQESLTNILRHASARHVRILLGRYGDHYELLISDDGVGFDQDAPRKGNSYGLLGISERVFILGGQLTVMSTQGSGTTLNIRFPRQPTPDTDT